MDNKEYIFQKIEKVACECVSEATGSTLPYAGIYSGHTKTTFTVSVARQLAFLFMHDHYGINYRRIAERAKMTVNAVMKCVGKAREYRFFDPVYNKVYQLMEERL